jgi:hypothetical protein
MAELPVAASLLDESPAVEFNQLDDVPGLHRAAPASNVVLGASEDSQGVLET